VEVTTNKGSHLGCGRLQPWLPPGTLWIWFSRGFYNGLEFIRAEDSCAADRRSSGPEEGFIDPDTAQYRAIPLEVLVQGDSVPTRHHARKAGRYRDQPVLPFSAMLQWRWLDQNLTPMAALLNFLFLFEPELTPAGRNLDGSLLGVWLSDREGKVLEELKAGDKIISAKVIQGVWNLK